MKKIVRYLPLAIIIIIITFGIVYFLSQKIGNTTINFVVMILLVLITDKYYLKRFTERKINVICKSYIWVFIISLITIFIYNGIKGKLTNVITNWPAVIIALIFLVFSSMIAYFIFYNIVYIIRLFYNKLIK